MHRRLAWIVGVVLMCLPAAVGSESGETRKLLPVAQTTPPFKVSTPTGGEISLAASLKGRKGVVLAFWSIS